jgi:hypothetical protein
VNNTLLGSHLRAIVIADDSMRVLAIAGDCGAVIIAASWVSLLYSEGLASVAGV